MLHVILLLFMTQVSDGDRLDFGQGPAGKDWVITNDGVMGGLSRGDIKFTENSAIFSGSISLDNNGGFTSWRTQYVRADLSAYKGMRMRLRGTSINHAFKLDDQERWWKPSYYASFKPSSTTEWEVIDFKWSDFKEKVIGDYTGDTISADQLGRIIRLGFITQEKDYTDFVLEIDYLEFY